MLPGKMTRFSSILPKRPSEAPAIGLSPDRAASGALNGKVLLFWAVTLAAACFFLLHAADPPAELTARFTIDDSFYYFETAWRTRLSGFVTFDSIHHANGVHFLWFMIVLGIAWLAPAKPFVLYGAYCASFVLVMGVYAAIWRVGTLVLDRGRLLTLLMALSWTFLLADRSNLFFVGMESTLHMAALWGCLIAFIALLQALDRSAGFPGRPFLIFTLFVVLVTWARLDSALYSLALYAFVAVRIIRRRAPDKAGFARALGGSLAIIAAGAAVQIGFYHVAGGTVLPISGLVKAAGVGPEIAAGTWARYMSVVFPIPTFVDGRTPVHLLAKLVLFSALLGYAVTRSLNAAAPMRHLYGFAATLGATTIVYAAIVGANHDPFWRWYLAPVYLFYIVTVACALREARESLDWRCFRIPLVAAAAGTVLSLFFVLLFFASYQLVPHYLARAQLGQFLKETTAETDILAAFNAGQVAFFSERRTINIDGLVNDRAFLRTVLNKPNRLIPYLRDQKVRYVADYDFYWADDAVRRGTRLKYAFPIKDDLYQRVLQVREVGGE